MVWEQFAIKGGGVVARGVRPGITAGLAATGELRGKMAIAEAGAAYEVARFGFPFGDVVRVPMAVDVLAGARYWYQEADVSFDIRATVDIADLVVAGRNRAIAKSGSVDWTRSLHWRTAALCGSAGPPGVRPRGTSAASTSAASSPGRPSAGYQFDFTAWSGITFSGLLGYRALYVDYAQGEGRRRYEFDMLQHGPVLGLTMRF